MASSILTENPNLCRELIENLCCRQTHPVFLNPAAMLLIVKPMTSRIDWASTFSISDSVCDAAFQLE
jgi:hypothetical protein